MFAIVLAALDRSGSVLPILYAMGVHELAHVVIARFGDIVRKMQESEKEHE